LANSFNSHLALDLLILSFSVAGWDIVNGRHFDHNDVYLAYLPLAHIMEFISEHVFLFWGVCIGYGSPRTLFDTSVEGCKGDLRELRPTFMVGVPAIWERARKSIMASIAASSPDQQAVFWDALRDKKKAFEDGAIFPSERDTAAFSNVRGLFGGRLRFMMTGGSGIAKHTQEFISFVVAPVTGGFGMTETTG
jgi:long-chain acyl-CoA synthetase